MGSPELVGVGVWPRFVHPEGGPGRSGTCTDAEPGPPGLPAETAGGQGDHRRGPEVRTAPLSPASPPSFAASFCKRDQKPWGAQTLLRPPSPLPRGQGRPTRPRPRPQWEPRSVSKFLEGIFPGSAVAWLGTDSGQIDNTSKHTL